MITLNNDINNDISTPITVDELAHNQLYVHPALPEVIEQALLGFEE